MTVILFIIVVVAASSFVATSFVILFVAISVARYCCLLRPLLWQLRRPLRRLWH